MNLAPIDWILLAVIIGTIVAVCVYASRLNRSVADFLSANRCAGRYLLTLAMGMGGFGAITIVANFEKYYQAGFGALWWVQMLAPLSLILALSGWVVYRFRATRAMTLAQFFEQRYSRRFRIFAGILAFIAGILNYGIFPIVTARFIVYFFGFPPELLVGEWTIPTVAVVMALMLGVALFITLAGGQITVMISDFLQSQLILISFLAITLILIFQFGWSEIMTSLVTTAPEGRSMVNPFDQAAVPDFNVFFFLMMAFNITYSYMAWQGQQGYNSSASSPHEAKMARVLAEWRSNIQVLMMVMIPVMVFAFVNSLGDAESIQTANATLSQLGDPTLEKQMYVPVVLSQLLPAGLFGLFCAGIIAAAISTDDTYLHSWGVIFVQDVVMPIRNHHISPEAHIRLLRCAIFGVAIFVYIFGLLFPLKEYIFMYWALTAAIYMGGAGSVILGGLYTRWGTTAGAWAAMITGTCIASCGIILRQSWEHIPALLQYAPSFPLNGIQVAVTSAIFSIMAYILISLLTNKKPFDLDSMMADYEDTNAVVAQEGELNAFQRLIGIKPEFTCGDRFIYYLKIAWVGFFFSAFVIGTTINLILGDVSDEAWVSWWTILIFIKIITAVATVIWFGIGGFRDLAKLFRTLRTLQRDEFDDGSVHKKNQPGD